MWRETLEDDNPTIEEEVRQGELAPIHVDPKLFHDLQSALSRLVGKASQLLGNAYVDEGLPHLSLESRKEKDSLCGRKNRRKSSS